MRALSITQIKRRLKGLKTVPLQIEPQEGSRIRELYDKLMSAPGKPVDLGLDRHSDASQIRALEIFYGLDIRIVRRASKRLDRPALYSLVGEYFGKVYVDYTCETEEQMDLLLSARGALIAADHAEICFRKACIDCPTRTLKL